MELRPYQKEAIEKIESQWNGGVQRTLLVLPTGCGKTIVFTKVAEDEVRSGRRVLILAHRGELLEQARDKIEKVTGLKCSLEKADSTCLDDFFRIVVGSVQTLQSDRRLSRFSNDYFDTIIIDEAHHSISQSYQNVLAHFDSARVLGVTATPDRSDMRNLGEYYESLAYEYTLPRAIKDGYLSPIRALTIPLSIYINDVAMSSGDFKASDLGNALDPYLEQIATEMETYCRNRKTVVFLPLVSTSMKFTEILNRHGFKAAEVNGESENRKSILADFDNDVTNVLCNSMLLTEGWDCPSVDCVIILRATKSRSLYSQMVGRGTRLAPGKKELLLIDFLWLTERHELCHPASLIASSEKVAQKMTETIENSPGSEFDILDTEEAAEKDVQAEREDALAKKLSEMRKRKKKLVDPLQYEMSIEASDLSGYEPSFGWEMAPASENQLRTIEKYGILPDEIPNAGYASMLIDRLKLRASSGMATPKQIRLLERYGFMHVGTWSFSDASSIISRISYNGWKIPRGLVASQYVPGDKENEEA